MTAFLQSDAFSALPNIRHGFFTRSGGVSQGLYASLNCAHGTGDDHAHVDENFRRIAQALGARHVLKAWQVHGTGVAIAREAWTLEERPRADAIVTAIPGMAVGVTTADCAPVLLADVEAGVAAAAHAGWKGALAGIIGETVLAMESLGARRERIAAVIGPAIQQASYEVSVPFREAFMAEDGDNARFFIASEREGHFRFDLPGFVRLRLEQAKLSRNNLLARDTCFEEDAFFSYRRATLRNEPAYGCQFSAIMVSP